MPVITALGIRFQIASDFVPFLALWGFLTHAIYFIIFAGTFISSQPTKCSAVVRISPLAPRSWSYAAAPRCVALPVPAWHCTWIAPSMYASASLVAILLIDSDAIAFGGIQLDVGLALTSEIQLRLCVDCSRVAAKH